MNRSLVTIITLVTTLLAGCSSAPPQSAPPPLAESSTAVQSTEASPGVQEPIMVQPAEWPRVVQAQGGSVTVHHPQIEDWENFEKLSGWLPLEVLPEGAEQAWVGSLLVAAQTDVDFDERLVILHDWEIRDRKFPDGEPGAEVKALVDRAISRRPRALLLDVLLRSLPGDFEIPGLDRPTPELNLEPPRIVVSTEPLQLMFVNGEPVTAPIEETGLEFVVNTNWDVFRHVESGRWYVLNQGAWQANDDLAGGGWESVDDLPDGFGGLPDNDNWKDVRAALPATAPESEPEPFLVSMEPSELLLLDGDPEPAPIEGTGINQVVNTQSDLFELDGRYYYLAAGRWFMADALDGDWSAVTELPEAFSAIPAEHDKGHVLVSVPDTPEARAALIEASIPRKASISKEAGRDVKVYYSGDPEWVTIEGTALERAVNTPYQIVAFNDAYYLCHNAVWYVASDPDGPWAVATDIPTEIYAIPATDPAHNVTYVYVDGHDDEYIDYHYTSGYTWTFAWSFAIVYGTGWYYDPWYYYHPWGYPAYWYYPHTYGYGAWYNPATGRYAERAVGYGPYGGIAATSVYNPRTGAYLRGSTVWDYDEVARSGYGYNPRTDTFAAGNMYYDFDDRQGWRESYVERGDRWVHGETVMDGNRRYSEYETSGGRELTRQTNRTDSGAVNTRLETGEGAQAAVRRQDGDATYAGRSAEGDLYAGRNGDVYKRGDDGWQKYENGSWSNAEQIERQYGGNVNRESLQSRASQVDRSQLNRQYNARQSGQRNYNNFQRQRGSFQRGSGARRRR